MITLKVEPYCDDCRAFEAEVTKPTRTNNLNGSVIQTDTIISCKNRGICSGIYQYMLTKRLSENCSNERITEALKVCTIDSDFQEKSRLAWESEKEGLGR